MRGWPCESLRWHIARSHGNVWMPFRIWHNGLRQEAEEGPSRWIWTGFLSWTLICSEINQFSSPIFVVHCCFVSLEHFLDQPWCNTINVIESCSPVTICLDDSGIFGRWEGGRPGQIWNVSANWIMSRFETFYLDQVREVSHGLA